MSKLPRLAAAVIALVAWVGLALQLYGTLQLSASILDALGTVLVYFTILTNLLVALTFTAEALGRRVPAWWLGNVTLAIALVGILYGLLLRDLPIVGGLPAVWANSLLHRVTPVLAVLFWIAYARSTALRWSDAVRWAVFPLGYLAFALVRGGLTGRYAYPFLHVLHLGWPVVLRNCTLIALCFIAASLLVIAITRRGGQTTAL